MDTGFLDKCTVHYGWRVSYCNVLYMSVGPGLACAWVVSSPDSATFSMLMSMESPESNFICPMLRNGLPSHGLFGSMRFHR